MLRPLGPVLGIMAVVVDYLGEQPKSRLGVGLLSISSSIELMCTMTRIVPSLLSRVTTMFPSAFEVREVEGNIRSGFSVYSSCALDFLLNPLVQLGIATVAKRSGMLKLFSSNAQLLFSFSCKMLAVLNTISLVFQSKDYGLKIKPLCILRCKDHLELSWSPQKRLLFPNIFLNGVSFRVGEFAAGVFRLLLAP